MRTVHFHPFLTAHAFWDRPLSPFLNYSRNFEDRPVSSLFDRPRILGPSTLILFNNLRSLEARPLSSLIDHPLLANFWDISEAVLLENSSIKKSWVPIQFLKKPGRHLDRFTGKFIQSSIGQFWGVTQTVLLENSSIKNHGYLFSFFQFWGVTQTVLLENSSSQFFKSFLIYSN